MATFPCICPPKSNGDPRHPNGDTVTLRDHLPFRAGLAARNTVILLKQEDSEATTADILASLTEVYLLEGIESWTLYDDKGKQVPVSRSTIRAFMADHVDEAMTVGEEADGLYSASVIDPLVKRAATFSQPTPTTDSTSPTNGSSPTPLKRPRPSSISTSRTAGTEKMSASHGGDYN
jgi:hypothetical protein